MGEQCHHLQQPPPYQPHLLVDPWTLCSVRLWANNAAPPPHLHCVHRRPSQALGERRHHLMYTPPLPSPSVCPCALCPGSERRTPPYAAPINPPCLQCVHGHSAQALGERRHHLLSAVPISMEMLAPLTDQGGRGGDYHTHTKIRNCAAGCHPLPARWVVLHCCIYIYIYNADCYGASCTSRPGLFTPLPLDRPHRTLASRCMPVQGSLLPSTVRPSFQVAGDKPH